MKRYFKNALVWLATIVTSPAFFIGFAVQLASAWFEVGQEVCKDFDRWLFKKD